MSILQQLASALGRRDEIPNQELAGIIAADQNGRAIKELVENLRNKNKNIQHDCIKVLYEIGEIDPLLIADYVKEFVDLLDHKNNRLQWGGMTALNTIASYKPKAIHAKLTKIIEAADKGSVITTDHAVNILIKLCAHKDYEKDAFVLLNEQLLNSPTNQLPMYAERAMPIINEKNKEIFINTLTSRITDIDKESKRKRVEKVIKRISGK